MSLKALAAIILPQPSFQDAGWLFVLVLLQSAPMASFCRAAAWLEEGEKSRYKEKFVPVVAVKFTAEICDGQMVAAPLVGVTKTTTKKQELLVS